MNSMTTNSKNKSLTIRKDEKNKQLDKLPEKRNLMF